MNIDRLVSTIAILLPVVHAADGNVRLKGMNNLRSDNQQFQQRMLAKGGNGGGGGGGEEEGGGGVCATPASILSTDWWDPYCAGEVTGDTFGASLVTKWMSIEPGVCVELSPYDNSGALSNICPESGTGNDIGFLLNGWVEEGNNSYQHWCKEGADGYDGTVPTFGGEGSGSPIAVSYIANKHKISIEVLVDGNVVDSGSSFWWPDDITNQSNPLYADGGFVVRVRNNGNSRKNVSSSSCFSVCVHLCRTVIMINNSLNTTTFLFTQWYEKGPLVYPMQLSSVKLECM